MSTHQMLSQRLRPWAVWLALCVALVGVLVPTFSHAVAWSQNGAPGYGAICTTAPDGVVASDADGAEPGPYGGQGGAASMAHCPFCLHSSDRAAPPPSPLVCAVPVQDGPQTPTVSHTIYYSAPRALVPPPRGPPLL
ncbi:DUF2946 family protein [Rhodoferax sp. AJA081-3]|uniref:DUF2946 family protein n=1 Tax=Rhodoferax sp. AJA081-3 TaxID=2752316 RepID=UPI001ADFEAA2|nr:DUF2946 family protein [Rhodoferax sp. AJA081-3]QTN28356.1 DUF2946 family protein [Rhodoferax sp. AJA081-3]